MPDGAAIVTLVGVFVSLEAAFIARGAGGAHVQPIAITVEVVFDVVLVYGEAVACRELVGFRPGGHFFLQQIYVRGEVGVPELGMADFV